MCNFSYHIGEHVGQSEAECKRCGSKTEGNRWQWLQLHQGRTHGAQARIIGVVCEPCVDEINHNN